MSLSVRLVLRALGDHVDRVLAIHCAGAVTEPPPGVGELRYCRRGRMRHEAGFVAFELIFDRILARGDTAVVEYELRFSAGRGTTQFYDRRFRHPAREYLCIIRFDRTAVPARCYTYECERIGLTRLRTAEVWIGTSRSAHIAKRNLEAGILGMEWEWE
jgi:hypothetical protein